MHRLVFAFACLTLAGYFISQMELPTRSSGQAIVQSGAETGVSSASVTPTAKYPTLLGRVVDQAGLLSDAERVALTQKLASFEDKSSDQVVVATIVSLRGENLEEYANGLFRTWELGQAQENNGVLLLIARDDRKIRIEVGYGLEGTLTDALAKTIIDQVIVPRFKSGNFGEGIVEGTEMIIAVLSGDSAELEARKKRNPTKRLNDVDWAFWIFILIWGTLFFGPIAMAILAPIFGKKLGKNRYRWLGMEIDTSPGKTRRSSSSGGWSGGGWSGGSSGGGFSGGGGSSGGGGASGGW